MIQGLIEEEHGEGTTVPTKWSVVAFTPWSCSDIAALTDEFYVAIASAMPNGPKGERAKELLTLATPFAKAVTKAAATSLVDKHLGKGAWKNISDAAAGSIVDSVADEVSRLAREQPPFVQRYAAISKAIQEAGRNVLVIIDDIDRLHADELLGVMKAVRLLGRFDRVHYLLSYDEETVIGVLTATDVARSDPSRAKSYLEKIVQYPLALPPIQLPYLETQLHEQLKATADRYALPITNSTKDWSDAIDQIIRATPDFGRLTLRSIYRWSNQLDILLTLVGTQELDLVDAALITYLRLWHNEVYLKLPAWRNDLIDGPAGRRAELTKEDWSARLRVILDQARDATDVGSIVDLLSALFPRVRQSARLGKAGPNICEGDFFNRYFTLGFPLGDVPDLDVRGDLEWLARNGSFGPRGVIVGSLVDPRIRYLVGNKALRSISVIEDAPSAQCASAAHELARLVSPMDGPWAQVIYALIGHAVSTAESSTAARALIDDFVDEFGVEVATDVFWRRLEYPVVDEDALLHASTGLRQDVLDACLTDLTTDVSDHDPTSPTVLRLLRYLDDDLWQSLREQMQTRLDDGTSDLAGLGARFVTIQPEAFGGRGFHEFFEEDFSKLLPKETWANYSVDDFRDDDVDYRATSLENRRVYAAVVVRKTIEQRAGRSEG
jgi:hypothetical protein